MKIQHLLKDSVSLSQASAEIRALACGGASVKFKWEARQQMIALGIEQIDILTVLKKCRVVRILGSSVGENCHYRVQGNTVDGKGVALRVRIEEPSPDSAGQLAVISVGWLEGGNHEQMQKVRIKT
jgi:hypothetical protein